MSDFLIWWLIGFAAFTIADRCVNKKGSSLMSLTVGAVAGLFGPIMVAVTLIIGAVVFLSRQKPRWFTRRLF